jgi:hypothetical protein
MAADTVQSATTPTTARPQSEGTAVDSACRSVGAGAANMTPDQCHEFLTAQNVAKLKSLIDFLRPQSNGVKSIIEKIR